jgi:potassium channel subfamily K member 18
MKTKKWTFFSFSISISSNYFLSSLKFQQDVMRGVNQVMDIVRRPSQAVTNMMSPSGEVENGLPPTTPQSAPPDTPQTEMSEVVIDDEFNLPISLAIFILLAYMIVGALVYFSWESSWTLFESFYFVFISMSTIGFGDYVPEHPMYMMCSIVYLIFGLALTSMCINVVQMKLSDSFRMASTKIGQTIGLQLAQQSAQGTPMPPDAMSVDAEKDNKVDMGDGAPPLPSKGSLSSRNSSPQRPPKRPDLLTPESERKVKTQK